MKQCHKHNQDGLVSLMITMVMMIIITLVVIGFSQIVRHNQREALDRQLSTQAYYAAESGINLATPYIKSHANSSIDTLSSNDCSLPTGLTAPTLGPDVTVSCLMLNTQPNSLVKNPVTQESPGVFHIKNANGSPLTKLAFKWTAPANTNMTGKACTAAATVMPSYTNWDCAAGVLRLDFVNAATTQASLDNPEVNTKTVYFVPSKTAALSGSLDLSTVNTNAYVSRTGCSALAPAGASCSDFKCGQSSASSCIGMVSGGLSNDFYVQVSMMYLDAGSVTVTAADAGSQIGGVSFAEGQAVVDATGKAQDELRRIQVRVPLVAQTSALPRYGLQSTNTICKRILVWSSTDADDNCSGISGL